MFHVRFVVVLVGTALAIACAREGARDDSPVVARMGGQDVTQNELDEWIRDQLFEEQVGSKTPSQQYEVRSKALQEMLDRRAVAEEAARRSTSEEDAIEAKVAELGPVTDEEVRAFFDEHKDRFRPPNNTFESRAAQIRQFLESRRRSEAVAAIRDEADMQILLEPPRVEVAATGPSIGPEDAPITIVEFSDFQCPFCSRVEPTIQRLVERYGDQVRLVYRHYPLERIHPRALPAAVASVCAGEQGKFWEYHALLFANQRKLSDADLKKYATDLGLDPEAFDACLAKPEVTAQVRADIAAGEAAGVSGTPAFFVNGIMVSGARSEQDFAEIIDAELRASAAQEPPEDAADAS